MKEAATILLVEDNPGDVRLMREVFKESGIERSLHVVGDGVEAIAFLRRRGNYSGVPRPDLILLDLNLPRKSGGEVLAEIKSDIDLKSIPVVIFTTSKSEEDIRTCYALNANCYITKPSDLDEFIAVVKAIENFWFKAVRLPVNR